MHHYGRKKKTLQVVKCSKLYKCSANRLSFESSKPMTLVVIIGGTASPGIVAMNTQMDKVKSIGALMVEVLTPTAGAKQKLLSQETSMETHPLTCSK